MMDTTVKLINLTDERDALSEVWRACFPEDGAFGEDFLRFAMDEAKCLGITAADGSIVSSAYFLPAEFVKGSERLSSYYVYGVGTLPQYRGNGYAQTILKEAANVFKADMFFLYPAKPSLRTFYEKMGYLSVLYCDILSDTPTFQGEILSLSERAFSAEDYTVQRTFFLKECQDAYAVFSDVLLQGLLAHATVLSCEDMVALCIAEGETVVVPELLCKSAKIPLALAAVKRHFKDKKVVAYTAGKTCATGMVLPCSEAAKRFFRNEKIPFFGSFFAE